MWQTDIIDRDADLTTNPHRLSIERTGEVPDIIILSKHGVSTTAHNKSEPPAPILSTQMLSSARGGSNSAREHRRGHHLNPGRPAEVWPSRLSAHSNISTPHRRPSSRRESTPARRILSPPTPHMTPPRSNSSRIDATPHSNRSFMLNNNNNNNNIMNHSGYRNGVSRGNEEPFVVPQRVDSLPTWSPSREHSSTPINSATPHRRSIYIDRSPVEKNEVLPDPSWRLFCSTVLTPRPSIKMDEPVIARGQCKKSPIRRRGTDSPSTPNTVIFKVKFPSNDDVNDTDTGKEELLSAKEASTQTFDNKNNDNIKENTKIKQSADVKVRLFYSLPLEENNAEVEERNNPLTNISEKDTLSSGNTNEKKKNFLNLNSTQKVHTPRSSLEMNRRNLPVTRNSIIRQSNNSQIKSISKREKVISNSVTSSEGREIRKNISQTPHHNETSTSSLSRNLEEVDPVVGDLLVSTISKNKLVDEEKDKPEPISQVNQRVISEEKSEVEHIYQVKEKIISENKILMEEKNEVEPISQVKQRVISEEKCEVEPIHQIKQEVNTPQPFKENNLNEVNTPEFSTEEILNQKKNSRTISKTIRFKIDSFEVELSSKTNAEVLNTSLNNKNTSIKPILKSQPSTSSSSTDICKEEEENKEEIRVNDAPISTILEEKKIFITETNPLDSQIQSKKLFNNTSRSSVDINRRNIPAVHNSSNKPSKDVPIKSTPNIAKISSNKIVKPSEEKIKERKTSHHSQQESKTMSRRLSADDLELNNGEQNGNCKHVGEPNSNNNNNNNLQQWSLLYVSPENERKPVPLPSAETMVHCLLGY